MAYDVELAGRVRRLVAGQEGLREQRMFGGLAFLLDGNMAVAASSGGGLLLRVDPAQTETLAAVPGARRLRMRGRELDGWLAVDAAAVETEHELEAWVARGVGYARSLPPKR